MKHDEYDVKFLEAIAKSEVGTELIKYLKKVEIHYADIRNLGQVKPEVRIDALNLFRESLLDKLLVLSGEIDPPNNDEFR